jgi:hypothetical protein
MVGCVLSIRIVASKPVKLDAFTPSHTAHETVVPAVSASRRCGLLQSLPVSGAGSYAMSQFQNNWTADVCQPSQFAALRGCGGSQA